MKCISVPLLISAMEPVIQTEAPLTVIATKTNPPTPDISRTRSGI